MGEFLSAVEKDVRKHYDAFPFDFFSTEDVCNSIKRKKLIGSFFENYINKGSLVVDVGCGIGRHGAVAVLYSQRPPFMIDLSLNSIKQAHKIYGFPSIQASNLALPLKTGIVDGIISYGVIQHTADPRRSFSECLRPLKDGGFLFLSCYRKGSFYSYLYYMFQLVVRILVRFPMKMFVIKKVMYRLFVLIYIWLPRGFIMREKIKRPDGRTWNFFADQFLNPQVSFFTKSTIENWCKKVGGSIVLSQNESGGQMLSLVIEKRKRKIVSRDTLCS